MYFWDSEYPFFQNTIFYKFMRALNLLDNFWYSVPNYNKDIIFKANQLNGFTSPTFCYIHLLLPHSPYNMDENGKILPQEELNHSKGYLKQILGLNKHLLIILDSIIQKDNNAIIILMGDHGSRILSGKSFLNESFDNFLAYYNLQPPDGRNNSISPVNIFRVVFKQISTSTINLLPHKEFNSLKGNE